MDLLVHEKKSIPIQSKLKDEVERSSSAFCFCLFFFFFGDLNLKTFSTLKKRDAKKGITQ